MDETSPDSSTGAASFATPKACLLLRIITAPDQTESPSLTLPHDLCIVQQSWPGPRQTPYNTPKQYWLKCCCTRSWEPRAHRKAKA